MGFQLSQLKKKNYISDWVSFGNTVSTRITFLPVQKKYEEVENIIFDSLKLVIKS